jgi:superfamily II DNA or RNA helicase
MPKSLDSGLSEPSSGALLGLAGIGFAVEYRTGTSDPISQFYAPCLAAANKYRRAVGYFRSSIYTIVGPAVLAFAKRGGTVLLVCSPELSTEDQDAIASGYALREKSVDERVEAEVDVLLADPKSEWRVKVLATLIATGRMEVKIAVRPRSHGIYHEKIGIFTDSQGNTVSFIGSANESWSGWHAYGNFESVEVFCSWRDDGERMRAARHTQNFDKLWSGTTPDVLTLPFPEAAKRKLCLKAAASIEDVERESEGKWQISPDLEKRSLMPHQKAAIDAWIEQGKRGVLEHATGSGKTFTALEAARPHIDAGLPVLILLPSDLLLKQWAKEVKEEFPEAAVVLAGGGNGRWKEPGKLRRISSPSAIAGRFILATMQTAATDTFRQALWQGQHLMIIADEVHQIGSPFNSQSLSIATGARLGLSATPQRYGDPDGTERILAYFGAIVQPPITLADAVASGRLVDYIYHPHAIRLSAREADEWRSLTKSIRFELAKSSKDSNKGLTDRAKMLLIRRSRIAKRATAKAPLAARILQESFEERQGWLIYCEDSDQLASTMSEIRAIGLNPIEYHSNMEGDRAATLDWFRRYGGVLVSIKCLDEGVDIPSVSHAIILASSQNPRQFIQRRGRVLRKSEGKLFATIHDAIVVPIDLKDEPEQGSLLKSEFLRAIEFSKSSINKSAGAELRDIAREVGFDPDEVIVDAIEEDGEP